MKRTNVQIAWRICLDLDSWMKAHGRELIPSKDHSWLHRRITRTLAKLRTANLRRGQ